MARVHPDDADRVLEQTRDAVAEGRDHDLTYRMFTADQRVVHVLDRVTVRRQGGGRTTIHGVTLDVTDRQRFEEQSRQYADIVEHIDVALIVAAKTTRADGMAITVVAANPAADQFLRTPVEAAPGRSLTSVLPSSTPAWVLGALWDVVERGEVLHLDDVSLARGNVHRERDPAGVPAAGRPAGGVAAGHHRGDAGQPRPSGSQALHDALTGLPNRAHCSTTGCTDAAASARAHRRAGRACW